MHGPTLDHEAQVRRFVRALLRDLRYFGYTEDQLRGKDLKALLKMKRRAVDHLMGPPGSRRAA